MNIGMRLKKLINEKGLKQKWVAEQIGMSEVNFNLVINGKKSPNSKYIALLAQVLNTSADYILGLEDRAS
jgi:repressor LexA